MIKQIIACDAARDIARDVACDGAGSGHSIIVGFSRNLRYQFSLGWLGDS